ncbi:Glutamate [NMDA] receptor subunit 1, partial [Gryllus bimaculatus]
CPPLEYVERRGAGGAVAAVRGLFPRVGVEVARQLNASALLLPWGDNDYGADSNGSWSGLVGAAQHGRVDLAINSFLMNPTRQAVIDFTTPIVLAKAGVFIREPEDSAMRWGLMAAPFANHLWLCVGAALGTLALAVAAVSRLTAPTARPRPRPAHRPRPRPRQRPTRAGRQPLPERRAALRVGRHLQP